MSAALSSYGLCKKRLAGSRRTVEENSLRRFNTQLLEDLRMSQRELNHLSYLLDLVLYTTDIFVSYLRYSPRSFALLRNDEDRSLSYQRCVCERTYSDNLEGEPPTKVGYGHVVPLRDRDALEGIRQVSLIDRRYRFKWSDHNLLCCWGLDFLCDDHVTDSDASVVPDETVDPYHSFALVRRVKREALRDRAPLSFEINYVSRGRVQPVHRVII